MNTAQGKMELLVLQAKAEQINEADFIADLVNKGLGADIIARLQILLSKMVYIGDQIIHIGKIILMKLWEFIKENPHMVIGFAIGVGLTGLSSMLIASVPFFGSVLSALITPIVALIVIPIGTLVGHRLDKRANNEITGDSLLEDLITISKKFWQLFTDILSSVQTLLKEKI